MLCSSRVRHGPDKGKVATGTHAGYLRHLKAGEQPCPKCKRAGVAFVRDCRRKREFWGRRTQRGRGSSLNSEQVQRAKELYGHGLGKLRIARLLQVSKPTVTAAIEGTGAYENGLVRVARLSAEQVLDIRVAAASGRTLTQVATDFHVARSTVKKVVQKKWPYTEGRLL